MRHHQHLPPVWSSFEITCQQQMHCKELHAALQCITTFAKVLFCLYHSSNEGRVKGSIPWNDPSEGMAGGSDLGSKGTCPTSSSGSSLAVRLGFAPPVCCTPGRQSYKQSAQRGCDVMGTHTRIVLARAVDPVSSPCNRISVSVHMPDPFVILRCAVLGNFRTKPSSCAVPISEF